MSDLTEELRRCAASQPDPFNPHWVDAAKRLMRQAADTIDAADEAVMTEYRLRTASPTTEGREP